MKHIRLLTICLIIFSIIPVHGQEVIYCKDYLGLYHSLEKNIYGEKSSGNILRMENGKTFFNTNNSADHLSTSFISTKSSLFQSDKKLKFSLKGGINYTIVIQSADKYKELKRHKNTSGSDIDIELIDIPEKIRIVFYADPDKDTELPTKVEILSFSKVNYSIFKEMGLALLKRTIFFGTIITAVLMLMIWRLKYLRKKYFNKKEIYNRKSSLILKFTVLTFVFLILSFFIESGAIFWLYTKKYEWTKKDASFLQSKNIFDELLKKPGSSLPYAIFPNPYTGFGYRKVEMTCSGNNVGFMGQDYPLGKKDPDKFCIMVVGGSVANFFAQTNNDGIRYLEDILNKNYDFGGKKAVVLNGGLGGGLHPQQLIAFELHAEIMDGIIEIDGFNEFLTLESSNKLGRPSQNFDELNPYVLSGGYSQMLLIYFNGVLKNLGKRSDSAFIKYAVYKFTDVFPKIINYFYIKTSSNKTTIDSIFQLPPNWNQEQRSNYNMRLYKNYIRMTEAIAKRFGIKSLFIIQPVPVIEKELTSEEKNNIKGQPWDIPDSTQKYLQMTKELLSLKAEGIPIYEILNVFKDSKETIYADPIHCKCFGQKNESIGHNLMAERIAEILEKEWSLKRK